MFDVPRDPALRTEIEFVMDQLVERGWLAGWARSGEQYALSWTPKGEERVRWLQTIERELDANERAFTVLLALANC